MMQYLKKAKERTAEDHRKLRQTVSEIIENVCESGDRALHEYSRRFDASDRASFRVSRDEIEAAYAKMTEQELADLKTSRPLPKRRRTRCHRSRIFARKRAFTLDIG